MIQRFRPVLFAITLGGLLGLASGLPGCTDGGPKDEVVSVCDPLALVEHEVSLGSILAAGMHEDGTIYVVSQSEAGEDPLHEFSLFRSAGELLEPQRISGMGSGSGEFGEVYDFGVTEDERYWTLTVLIRDGETSMYFNDAMDPLMDPANPAGDRLELLDDALVRGMKITPEIEAPELYFAADVEDDKLLVITCDPKRGCPFEGRLFYGPIDAVYQRELTELGGSCDGTWLEFRVDDADAELYLGSEEASLSVGGVSLELHARDDIKGATFYCDPELTLRSAPGEALGCGE